MAAKAMTQEEEGVKGQTQNGEVDPNWVHDF